MKTHIQIFRNMNTAEKLLRNMGRVPNANHVRTYRIHIIRERSNEYTNNTTTI